MHNKPALTITEAYDTQYTSSMHASIIAAEWYIVDDYMNFI